jgi:cytoskeleton protein RodZ
VYDERVYDEKQGSPARRLGRRLELSRRGQGLTLEEMQRRTKIWAHQLEALERGDFGALPNPSWARGLTITYVNSLGLEGEALAEAYFPQPRSFRPKGHRARRSKRRDDAPLRRHWNEALSAALGAIVATVIVVATAMLFPYNDVTGGLNDFLNRIAPRSSRRTNPSASPS